MIPGTTSSQGKFVDPPTSVSASAGNGQATVSFTFPVYDGKGVATFVTTSSPGGFTASGASSPLTVTGLSNGTAYTFTVEARGGYGVNRASSASNSVSPVAPTTTTTTTTTTAAPTTTATPCGPCAWNGVTYSCVGTLSYEYVTCGGAGCPGEGGQNPAYRNGVCGYVTPATTTTTTTEAPATTTTTTATPATTACSATCTPACGAATLSSATACGGSVCCGCESGCPGCWSGQRRWARDNYTYSQQSCVDACGTTRYRTCASFSVDSTVSSTCC